MRPWMLIALAIFLGLVMGVGMTMVELGASPAGTVQADFLKSSGQGLAGDRARIATDAEEFEFGTMEHDTSKTHTFTVRNEGKGPLVLTNGGVSCGQCTSFSITKGTLEPGESTTVEVTWKGINTGPFRQSATVNTNDPMRPSVSFTITGKVLSTYVVSPSELVFSNISVTDSPTAELEILSYHSKDLAVLSHELTDAETADHFEIKTKAMSAERLAQDPDAQSGVVVSVTIKPGLPLETIRQKIRLQLNLPDKPEVEVPVEGFVTSDMQIVGRDTWDARREVVNFGTVNRSEGAKTEVMLLVRGEHRHELNPKVQEVNPSWLKVTIGKPEDLDGGKLVRVPVTIAIPPGSPAGVHLGQSLGPLGEVVIETGHPEAKMVRLRVRFGVGE